MKIEYLKWLLKNEDGLQKCDFKSIIPSIINCFIDKSKDVRIIAEHVIIIGLNIVSVDTFRIYVKDLKPTIKT